jgi:glycosyltransferase involved in cell wall biosynthesis
MQYNDRKHLAFAVSSFRSGGGEKQIVEIAGAFAAQGHVVDLIVLKPVGQLADQVDPRVRIVSVDGGRMLFSLPKIVAYLRKEQPDIVLATDEYTQLFVIIARMWTGAKMRIILRIGNMLTELFDRYEGKSSIIPFFVRRYYKRADHIIANSRGVADDVILVTGIAPEKVSVIYNPKPREKILAEATEPVDHPWLVHKTMPVVIAVGRLREQKNFAFLIRTFASVLATHPARLIIVGAGREEGRLRELMQELGCEEFVFLAGYADNPYAWLAKADLYVAASLWEGLPNSLLEALVCGLPAIAADCSSGPREILAPETDYRKRLSIGDGVEYAAYGALYAVNDGPALASALIRFLGDAELRGRYGTLATERSRAFDAGDIVGEYARAMGL